jgi:hypothetical protein
MTTIFAGGQLLGAEPVAPAVAPGAGAPEGGGCGVVAELPEADGSAGAVFAAGAELQSGVEGFFFLWRQPRFFAEGGF